MSIASDIKKEIIEAKIPKGCCQRAFLSGVIRGSGSLFLQPKGLGLIIQHPSEALILKCAAIVKQITKVSPLLLQKDKDRALGSKVVFELSLDGEYTQILLKDTAITTKPLEIDTKIPQKFLDSDCCKKSFIKGLFAASGLIYVGDDSEDKSKGYLMELTLSSKGIAVGVKEILDSYGITASIRTKKSIVSVYVKDSEKIGDFCALIGASKGYFAVQEIILSRLVKNTANRLYNCEIANIDRTLDAAARQLKAIKKIERIKGLSFLDDGLFQTANARINYPSASMSELLTLIDNPPTKSGLNHRMRKLIEIAGELEGDEENAERD